MKVDETPSPAIVDASGIALQALHAGGITMIGNVFQASAFEYGFEATGAYWLVLDNGGGAVVSSIFET